MRGKFPSAIFVYSIFWLTVAAIHAAPPATLSAAIEAFTAAAKAKDAAAMATFYCTGKTIDKHLALANASRVLAAAAFAEAGKAHLPLYDARGSGLAFTLSEEDLDFPRPSNIQENGDEAVLTLGGPDQKTEWFRRTDGAWKLDITPAPPLSVSEAAQDMDEDAVTVNRITNSIKSGNLKTWRQVRDALGEAMPNEIPVPEQLQDDVIPPGHERADPHDKFSTDSTTPAGAMNRFIKAIERSDEAILSDSLYMPTDKTGEYRAAAAHDRVAGLHLLLAAESKFPDQEDSDRVCYWLGGVKRYEMRGYTDDEWQTTPDQPNLATSSNTEIKKVHVVNGQNVTVMEMSGVPLMHHCSDGHWRLGPRFPKNVRKLQEDTELLREKDKILERAVIDLRNGKYANDWQAINAVAPELLKLGPSCTPIH